MRRTTSSWSESLTIAGAVRVLLSSDSITSAMLRAGRVPAPAKMTSSISEPRICLADVSPITHFSASTRFDLPQPLGPTMPVMPDSITSSVGSTKDLKPESRSLSNWTIYTTPRVDPLLLREFGKRRVHLLDGTRALELRAVDEQRRSRIHTQRLAAAIVGDHAVGDRIVGEARLDLVLAHAGDAQRLAKLGHRVRGGRPLGLGLEDHVDHAEVLVLAGALGELGRLERGLVEREVAVDQLHLAGVDPLLLQLGQDGDAEMRTVRAGQRGILDQGDRRLGIAQDVIVRLHLEQRRLVGRLGDRLRRRRRGRRAGAKPDASRNRGHGHDA